MSGDGKNRMGRRNFILIALLALGLDQISKWLAVTRLAQQRINCGVFDLNYVTNSGGAFGMFPKMSWLYTIVGLAVIAVIWASLNKILALPKAYQWCMALVAGGALGNIVDRLRLKHVVDFIDFRFWPVFNLADSFIFVGVLGLIVLELKGKKADA